MTHNFVSAANLGRVLRFLRTRDPALVSGCAEEDVATLHDCFVSALEQERPELLRNWQEEQATTQQQRQEGAALTALFKHDGEPDINAAAESSLATAGFSFGFEV